ncbi:MAG: TonB-dependent receptor [Sinobacteraceae bacterium]|nr:TonB-dependent receptor [Nevskiaceae bacterium]MCP5339919.1 TonB-dependent receptor [Nevskiaceae bacterium]
MPSEWPRYLPPAWRSPAARRLLPPSGGLEEIVVTAERREASLQSVPVAVSALSAEAIENRQVVEARDLQRFAPSLRMSNNITSPTNLSPSLRGSLQQDASLVVAESPFGIYVDDVYIARLNGNNVTLADIERVEVLRGPQGTLYGRNTLAGAIKFVTRDPGASEWFNAKLGIGNWDQYVASLSVGKPINDNWSMSFSAQVNNKDGQWKNIATGEETGLEQNQAYRAKLAYRGDSFKAMFSFAYVDSKNDSNQMLPGGSGSVPTNSRYTSDDVVLLYGNKSLSTPAIGHGLALISDKPRAGTQQTIASANLSWDIGIGTIRSITGYVKTDDFFTTDFSGRGATIGASNPRAEQWSQELQLQGAALNDRLNYLVGAYYFTEDGKQDFAWFLTVLGGPTSTSQIRASTDSVSIFAQADYAVTDRLKLTAGVRYVEDDKDFALDFQRRTAIPLGPLTDAVALSDKYDEVTPKFGIDYTVDTTSVDSLLLYASVARGFKSGGYNGINITNANIARAPYGPESNWTYEAGAKMDLLDRRLRINAAAFQAKIEDLALNATVEVMPGVFDFPVQNAGEATVRGLEIETTFVPTDNLTVYLNTSFLDGKYDSLNPTSAPAVAQLPQIPGNNNRLGVKAEPPQLPSYTFTLGFDYSVPTSFGRVNFGADWYRTDDYITAATNDFVVKAYDRFNGYVGVGVGDHWDIRLNARNIADDQQVYVGSRGLGGFLMLPPREVMLTLSYKL